MSQTRRSAGWYVVWILAVVLAILHYDVWYWDDTTLVLGFLPVGLAFHAGFSLACGALWLAAIFFAWPSHLEEWADGGDQEAGS